MIQAESSRPCTATELPQTLWHRLLWALYARVYDALWGNELAALTGAAVAGAITRWSPDKQVLEVGAGTGLITQHLVHAGLSVVASEPMKAMRTRLKRRLPTLRILPHSITELLQEPPSKTVVAANVVHLTSDPLGAISFLRELAGVDGWVILVSPLPSISVFDVARAQRRLGLSRILVARFVGIHFLLAPLIVLAHAGLHVFSVTEILETPAVESIDLAGTMRLLVLTGSAPAATAEGLGL